MTKFTTLGSKKLSPQKGMPPRQTLLTEAVAQLPQEEDEEDDMPFIIFDWEHDNAAVFLQRWGVLNAQADEFNPPFERPANLQNLYSLLLKEFARDIDGTTLVGNSVIQCASSIAAVFVTGRIREFELRPWVSSIIDGELPGSAKLANLFMSTTVHKSKLVKLEGNLF